METNRYHVDCPAFDQVDIDYRKQKRTVWEYCHPVDEKIIRKLDNPAVNTVFKTLIDLNVDQQFGQMLATGIPVNQQNYPREDEMLRQCSEILGIRRPYAIISGSEAGINAFTTGSDEEPYLILTSLLVKTLGTEQLKFVIGHECGHIAMGHVVYHSAMNAAGSFSRLIPLIGPAVYNFISFPMKAWERRSEITADRAGLICCRDLQLAEKTLLQLVSVFQNADDLDVDSYIENSRRYLKRGILRRIGEYHANHPLIAKRIEALRLFAASRCYYEMTGQSVPADAISNAQLEEQTEKIIQVL